MMPVTCLLPDRPDCPRSGPEPAGVVVDPCVELWCAHNPGCCSRQRVDRPSTKTCTSTAQSRTQCCCGTRRGSAVRFPGGLGSAWARACRPQPREPTRPAATLRDRRARPLDESHTCFHERAVTPSAEMASLLASALGRQPTEAAAPATWLQRRRSSSDELSARGHARRSHSRGGMSAGGGVDVDGCLRCA